MHIKATFKNKEDFEEARKKVTGYGGIARMDEINRILYCNHPEDVGQDIVDICDGIQGDKSIEVHYETY